MAISQILNYIEDDWSDNKLQNRDNSEEGYFLHPSDDLIPDYEAGDALKGVYQPEWRVVNSGPTIVNSRIEHDTANDGDGEIKTSSTGFKTGTWQYDFHYLTLGNDNDAHIFYFLQKDSNNRYRVLIQDDLNKSYKVRKIDEGSSTDFIDTTWSPDSNQHTQKITRDSYGKWEILLDGSSQGSATDNFMPSPTNEIRFLFFNSAGGSKMATDNLVVK